MRRPALGEVGRLAWGFSQASAWEGWDRRPCGFPCAIWHPAAIWPSRADGDLRPLAPDLASCPCCQLVTVTLGRRAADAFEIPGSRTGHGGLRLLVLAPTLTRNFYSVKQRYKLFLPASWMRNARNARVCEELCRAAAGSFCQVTQKHLSPREPPPRLACRKRASPLAVTRSGPGQSAVDETQLFCGCFS